MDKTYLHNLMSLNNFIICLKNVMLFLILITAVVYILKNVMHTLILLHVFKLNIF